MIPTWFWQRFWRSFLYVGKRLYRCRPGQVEVVVDAAAAKPARVVVLGKAHYHESVQYFAFSSLRDIRSAIRMDMPSYCPFETDRILIRKVDLDSGGCRVNLWFVHPDAESLCRRLGAWVGIPVSALFSLGAERPETLIHAAFDEERLWMGIDRWRLSRSIDAADDTVDREGFCRMLGGQSLAYETRIVPDRDSFFRQLADAFLRLSPIQIAPFLRFEKMSLSLDAREIRLAAGVAAGLFLVYSGILYAMLEVTGNRLTAENRRIETQVQGLLDVQRQIDAVAAQKRGLLERLGGYVPRTTLLMTINEILPENTRIYQTTISGSQIELSGVTPNGTALLEAFSAHPAFRNVRFSAPLRKEKATDYDAFTLSMVYDGAKAIGKREG